MPSPPQQALSKYRVYRQYRFVQLQELTKIGEQAGGGICFVISLDWLRRWMGGKRGLKDQKFNPHRHLLAARSARAAASTERRDLTTWHHSAFAVYEDNRTEDWATILQAIQASSQATTPFSGLTATSVMGEGFDDSADVNDWIAPLLRSMKHVANRTGLFLSLLGPGRGIGHAVACHYEVAADRFRFFDPNVGEYAVGGSNRGIFERLVAANLRCYVDHGFKIVRPTFFH